MLRGVATATSELLAQSKRLETLAANLADADTPGYRADRLDEQTFSNILLDRIDQGSTQVGPIELGPVMSRPSVDLATGPIEQTGRALDVALTGPGFFVVQSPSGLQYTRRGAFQQDASGRLVSLEGWPVLGQNGPIAGAGPLRITDTGQVMSGQQVVGQLQVVGFPTGTTFDRRAGTYLVPTGGGAAQPIANAPLLAGHLEGSNVDLTTTVTDMMAASRSYQAAQKALTTQDAALGTLIQQVNGQ